MQIVVLEPFYTESHKKWLDNLCKYSNHEVIPLTLSGFHWKWRMHGAAVTLAKAFTALRIKPDLFICSDMLDVNVFIGLTRSTTHDVPIVLYFHENQITYPWSPADQDVALKRDRHYGFINYTSALSANAVLFNSVYHQQSFLSALGQFLNAFPDFKNLDTIDQIAIKSIVLPLGMELSAFDKYIHVKTVPVDGSQKAPILLWNHRWEYDKNPDLFFNTLIELKEEGIQFQLLVLGKSFPDSPPIFEQAQQALSQEILHWGYVESFEEYASLLCKADILPVTSNQDFFGISVVEAIYCGAIPLLPDRLAYREHVTQDEFFYLKDENFKKQLRSFLLEDQYNSKIDMENILSYEWSKQIVKYDATFSKLSANFAGN